MPVMGTIIQEHSLSETWDIVNGTYNESDTIGLKKTQMYELMSFICALKKLGCLIKLVVPR